MTEFLPGHSEYCWPNDVLVCVLQVLVDPFEIPGVDDNVWPLQTITANCDVYTIFYHEHGFKRRQIFNTLENN